MSSDYRICNRCIMDTSDPEITFDNDGRCNHCRNFDEKIKGRLWLPGPEGQRQLEETIAGIKKAGQSDKYDCIIGLSGGVDSSYLVFKAIQWGLRPLAVHVDAGWNTKIASENIEVLSRELGFDLHTVVIDRDEMRDLQVAFLRSGVANQDTPQDHAFFAALNKVTISHKIKYIINGHNFATESILPASWGHDPMDLRMLRAIHQRFGTMELKTFPTLGFWERYLVSPYIRGIKIINPLNFIPYDKKQAIDILEEKFGWKDYGGKHLESTFTKFFQQYYLPEKLGIDKRRAHLSSLIVSGLISREKALEEISSPPYCPGDIPGEMEFIAGRLNLLLDEFKRIIDQPVRSCDEFPSDEALKQRMMKIKHTLKHYF